MLDFFRHMGTATLISVTVLRLPACLFAMPGVVIFAHMARDGRGFAIIAV